MSATGSGSGKAKKSVKTTRKKKLARKAVSMPDLGPDRPDRPDRKVGLPKISTRIRESQPMILTSPTCLAILEQLHELVSGPWSSSAFLPLSPSVSGASSTASPPHPTRVAASSTPPLTRARSVSSASSTSSSSSSPRSSSSSSSSSRRDASLTKRQSSECSLPDLEMRAGDVKIGTSLLSGSPISASAPSLLQPTKDVLKDGTRASSGDSYHFQVSTITNAAPSIFAQTTGKPPPAAPVSASFSTSATHPVTLDVRRKIGKYILALKRVLDKDGSSVDSQAQKILFSKSTPNIAVLIKCLRVRRFRLSK
ncbi:hypothetical protein DFS34DRAFT_605735 [Phlyctochytrium arcticum]|nr:hypothetical protein DFS34DRAFT_605735 [Phlyctochytrium arcticum]